MAKVNHSPAPDFSCLDKLMAEDQHMTHNGLKHKDSSNKKYTFLDLFNNIRLLKTTLLFIFVW